ncbi:hypothetical protein CGMCC3_g3147 [Colletotrichum fructicola]|nr:uncharacterized protein CGMCC3_g3147 [Colletotrichum fructicola]KAE9580935.1 hypothetical protein CGMCC3_g3147 [Colletotrichum fructicola]
MELYVSDGKETTMYGLVLEEVTLGGFKRKAAFSIDYRRLQLLEAEEHEDDSQGLEVRGSLGFQQLEIQLV